MNILHAIDRSRVTPEHFVACIEIPAGCKNKYELDVETGALMLDRVLYTSTHYPQNYGFIPRTWSLDEDPLDVLVLTSESIVPMSLVRCYPIGVLKMVDSGEVDEKILAICENDPFYNTFKTLDEVPVHILEEITHFFQHYKELEHGKDTIIQGFFGKEEAMRTIADSRARYDEKFSDR
ncbi:MAG: inorganic diphosphatase [Candidatus Enteromonas sp.]|nr:inorganic diphosphatase [Candidatus Enteromonas sp.]